MMENKDVYRLIRSIRNNWGSQTYDFDRGFRALFGALFLCNAEISTVLVATIQEMEKRQLYQTISAIGKAANANRPAPDPPAQFILDDIGD